MYEGHQEITKLRKLQEEIQDIRMSAAAVLYACSSSSSSSLLFCNINMRLSVNYSYIHIYKTLGNAIAKYNNKVNMWHNRHVHIDTPKTTNRKEKTEKRNEKTKKGYWKTWWIWFVVKIKRVKRHVRYRWINAINGRMTLQFGHKSYVFYVYAFWYRFTICDLRFAICDFHSHVNFKFFSLHCYHLSSSVIVENAYDDQEKR